MRRRAVAITTILTWLAVSVPPVLAQEARLLRHPDASDTQIVFAYANDLWIVGRSGGTARRLTTYQGQELRPRFSPDGHRIAFTGQYDGNTDVYVTGVDGGQPERLTWHPYPDVPIDWSADGSRVIFRSFRTSAPIAVPKFWEVPVEGGFPRALAPPRVWAGQFNADMSRLAYRPVQPWDAEWRNYRGGQAGPIWLLDMDDFELEKLPWEGSNDTDPVWLGEKVYFLSDRDWAANLWEFDPASGELTQLTHHREFDAKNLAAGGGVLVYECGGFIRVYDPAAGTDTQVSIRIGGDLPWVRPHWESVGDQIRTFGLSPTGQRAVFEARGDIFPAPAESGDVRNLPPTPAAADPAPSWSPDGSSIAWFSDAGGEYALTISDQRGLEEPRRIELADPTFYFTPAWSPDSQYVLFTDEGLNLSYVDVASGEQILVDTDSYAEPNRTIDPVWSPDSRWIAYSKRLDSLYHAIMVYSLETGETHQVTDAMSDAIAPAWDRNGKYLYFLVSTNYGLTSGWLDLSSIEAQLRREVYFAVLPADLPSPLLPESDEEVIEDAADGGVDDGDEEASEAGDTADEDDGVTVRIDFEGLDQRILSLGLPARRYVATMAGPDETLFYAEQDPDTLALTLHKYTFEDEESTVFVEGVSRATVSADGEKLLYDSGGSWSLVGTAAPPAPGDGALATDLRMLVDPRQEWAQIFREAWRYQRDFFYVENLHGADWDWVWEAYSPWVDSVAHRDDLVHLLDILGGETAIGHSFTCCGDYPDVAEVSVGLLGADFEIDRGRYRIVRIYRGANWNPVYRSPLSAPGIDVAEGDYLLAVDGVELLAATNLYSLFEGTVGRQTVIEVGPAPDGSGSREVTVVPAETEAQLRQRTWVEDNRRKVDEMSDGRLAYVWLPNTAGAGYEAFNREYFAQQDRAGAVLDERFNGGGFAADYIIDLLARDLQGFFNNPVGDKRPFFSPGAGIWGPKVMIVNESAGSGGDYMPWMFRNKGLGPLIGTRTWGGLVGIWDVPPLIDGGFITAPRGGFYTLEGEWAVENEGVAPDIEVEQLPAEVIAGRDPQLEAAVAEALRLLDEKDWPGIVPQPPDPIRARRPVDDDR